MRHGDMKKDIYFLRGDNRGASLIAVVVALVFVATMGAVIADTTIANIQMRGTEQSMKVNFYNADAVMNDLKSEMAEVAADKMQDAYTEMLTAHGAFVGENAEDEEAFKALKKELQEEFQKKYLNQLAGYFYPGFNPDTSPVTWYPDGEGENAFGQGEYAPSVVTALVEKLVTKKSAAGVNQNSAADKETFEYDGNTVILYTAAGSAKFTMDYKEGLFTLKNLKIEFQDENGYATQISTDLVFGTPEFPFNDGATSIFFMDYALIADSCIEMESRSNSTVYGSVYAGAKGIVSEKAVTGSNASEATTAEFYGDNIVTRGDIVANNSSALKFGDRNKGITHVWAQNLITKGKSQDGLTNLEMDGEINIADDLTLNGTNSKVKLSGSYNGYNFLKDYWNKDAAPSTESKFSSAIMINGENCSLDLDGLDSLYLAGRTFISPGNKNLTGVANNNNDIMLGGSLSVRSDQLAYFVNDKYVKEDPSTGKLELTDDGIKKYLVFELGEESNREEVSFETDYATNGNIKVAAYHYRNNSGEDVQYYLSFTSGEVANRYFKTYWDKNQELVKSAQANGEEAENKLTEYGGVYATQIQLDSGSQKTALILSGDLLQHNSSSDFELRQVEIGDAGTSSTGDSLTGWENPESIYWDWSDKLARTYKSLQDDLAGVYTRVKENEELRFEDNTTDTLFKKLINRYAFDAMMNNGAAVTEGTHDKAVKISEAGWEIVLCNNEGGTVYTIPSTFKGGIVIATGDVEIGGAVTGMVISGGTITLTGTGVSVNAPPVAAADPLDVKSIFDEIKGKEYGLEFAAIFNGYHTSGMDGVWIGDYLYYENWMKNEE